MTGDSLGFEVGVELAVRGEALLMEAGLLPGQGGPVGVSGQFTEEELQKSRVADLGRPRRGLGQPAPRASRPRGVMANRLRGPPSSLSSSR